MQLRVPATTCCLLALFCTMSQFKMVCLDNVSGDIKIRVDNFPQYVNSAHGTQPKLSAFKPIRGMHWQLYAGIRALADEKKYLLCTIGVDGPELGWNCAARVTVDIAVGENKICSQSFEINFSMEMNKLKFEHDVQDIMDQCNSSQNNTVILTASVRPDPPCGKSFPFTDKLLVKENEFDIGRQFFVNKKLLALHSPLFFDKLFYGATGQTVGSSSSSSSFQPIVQLDPPATLEHFKTMISLLHIGEKLLKDETVENVLRLSHQFLMEDIQGKCSKFLLGLNCKLSTLRRFRIASEHGLDTTKNILLKRLNRADFNDGAKFMENHNQLNALSSQAKGQVIGHYYQIFPESMYEEDHNKRQKIIST